VRIEKLPLSESAKGAPIFIGAGASPGTLVHTVLDSTDIMDTIHLWAYDAAGSSPSAYVELIDSSQPFNTPNLTAQPVKIVDGAIMEGGTELRCYETSGAAFVSVFGYVLRIHKEKGDGVLQ
jgi:hypothetical protein